MKTLIVVLVIAILVMPTFGARAYPMVPDAAMFLTIIVRVVSLPDSTVTVESVPVPLDNGNDEVLPDDPVPTDDPCGHHQGPGPHPLDGCGDEVAVGEPIPTPDPGRGEDRP